MIQNFILKKSKVIELNRPCAPTKRRMLYSHVLRDIGGVDRRSYGKMVVVVTNICSKS